jgi:hypothetical protein
MGLDSRNQLWARFAGHIRSKIWGLITVVSFGAIRWVRGPIYMAYHPDSNAMFHAHPEFRELYGKWVFGNKVNNGGDVTRFYAFILNVKQVLQDGINGDFAELGVWRGNSAAILAHFARANGRRVYLFDTFTGFDRRDLKAGDASRPAIFGDTSLGLVKSNVGHDDVCVYIVGFFPDSITTAARETRYAFVSLDCDLYAPMKAGLEFFYPRLVRGGTLLLHDYSSLHWRGAKAAIDEFCSETSEHVVLLPDKSGTAVIRKSRVT